MSSPYCHVGAVSYYLDDHGLPVSGYTTNVCEQEDTSCPVVRFAYPGGSDYSGGPCSTNDDCYTGGCSNGCCVACLSDATCNGTDVCDPMLGCVFCHSDADCPADFPICNLDACTRADGSGGATCRTDEDCPVGSHCASVGSNQGCVTTP